MDLYRYFHPHHNPRLRNTALRLQELAELQQAAIELTRALKRAQIRVSRVSEQNNDPDNASNLNSPQLEAAIEAADVLVAELIETTKLCPDDDLQTMKELLNERKNAPGWETWRELLQQRLVLEEENSVHAHSDNAERQEKVG